jgi:hypothetical protein
VMTAVRTRAAAGKGTMSINCEVILRWDATPAQQRALGRALWGWCHRAAGGVGTYQYLDNQGLADLLAGRPPAAGPPARDGGRPRVLFSVPGDPARDREALLESLRRAVPDAGTADVRVGGVSWRPPEGKQGPTRAVVQAAHAGGLFVQVSTPARGRNDLEE